MNAYIVSQWFKNKGYLEKFYQDNFQYILDHYYGKSLFFISDDMIDKLLEFVINRDADSLSLKYVSASTVGIDDGSCFYYQYRFVARDGVPWKMTLFYGTYDDSQNISIKNKRDWIRLLMHFFLNMVQNIKRWDETDNMFVVSRNGRCFSSIKCIIDFEGINSDSRYYCANFLSSILLTLSNEEWKPLLSVLTKDQSCKVINILEEYKSSKESINERFLSIEDDLYYDVEGFLKQELHDLERDTMYEILETIANSGLKGYLAICELKPFSPTLNYYYGSVKFRCDKNPYEEMEKDDFQFNGKQYVLVTGESFDKLMENVNNSCQRC